MRAASPRPGPKQQLGGGHSGAIDARLDLQQGVTVASGVRRLQVGVFREAASEFTRGFAEGMKPDSKHPADETRPKTIDGMKPDSKQPPTPSDK